MKIFEYIKGDKERTLKVMGLTLMQKVVDYKTTEKFQYLLGGLISTCKILNREENYIEKNIKISGHPLIKCIEKNNYKTYYLGTKEVLKKSLLDDFKKKYFKHFAPFKNKHNDIYILKANSGEIYLTLTYIIEALIKRNGSKSPLLVATKKYHVDMIKMFCPDIPYIFVKDFDTKIVGDSFKIESFRFFLLYDSIHFRQVDINIQNNISGKNHYFKAILDRLQLAENSLSMQKALIIPDAEFTMLEKIKKIGLNINNFIFIAPEALSCKLYDDDFWVILINKLHKQGYHIFVNLMENRINLKNAIDIKSCFLSYAEAFALAKHAKKIISLRSGFTEFLLQTNVPIDVLYTKFKQRCASNDLEISQVLSGFSLKELPFVDCSKIQEFNMYEISPKDCIEQILTKNW